MNSTTLRQLPQNNGQLHGGIIALILLGCIVFVVLVGLFLAVVYLRKSKCEKYTLKWEKKCEESFGSFEMLDREMNKLPFGRRTRNAQKANTNLIENPELESVV